MNRPLPAVFGAALVMLGVGAVIISTAFGGRPRAELTAPNAPVNAAAADPRDVSAHSSPTLVRSPVNERLLAIANRIDSPRFSCALHSSADGGARWRQVAIPVPRGEEPTCHAPDVAFGADGTLYLSFVTLRGPRGVPSAVWVASSKNGGRTLSRPSRALGPLSFQVRLVADPSVPGRLYLSYLQVSEAGSRGFAGEGNPIRLRRSDDGGRSWKAPARVSDPARTRVVAPSPAVGRGQQLAVLYLDVAGDKLGYEGARPGRGDRPYRGPWRLVLARSQDGGKTFKESVVEDALQPTERFSPFLPPFPSLALDPERGRAYVAFEDGRLGDADVWVWASDDGGRSWAQPVRVNDTPRRDGRSQYRPQLAVAPNGRLDVVYYDRRADRRNRMNEVSMQSSFDAAQSFGVRLGLSDRPFDSRVGSAAGSGMAGLGSRLGLFSADASALAVWSDTRGGTRASGKQDLARAVVAFSEPTRLSQPVRYAVRLGGVGLALAGLVLLALWFLGRAPLAGLVGGGDRRRVSSRS